MVHDIDIVGGATVTGSQTVRGKIHICTDIPALDEQIAALYRGVDRQVAELVWASRPPVTVRQLSQAELVHEWCRLDTLRMQIAALLKTFDEEPVQPGVSRDRR